MEHFFNTSVNSGNVPGAQNPTDRKRVQHTGSLCSILTQTCGHGDTGSENSLGRHDFPKCPVYFIHLFH